MEQTQAKYLIFDLGGVIINLDTQLTIAAFAQLLDKTPSEVIEFSVQNPIFHAYEKGEVSSEEFRNAIRKLTPKAITDQDIDHAWNAMILDLPKERLELLERLKKSHQLFLLSNTNYIHMERVHEVMKASDYAILSTYFHGDYYSHLMGKRKPDIEIYEQVLEENNLNPSETVFFDDNADNINGAAKLGIQTVHVTSPKVMMEYFNGR